MIQHPFCRVLMLALFTLASPVTAEQTATSSSKGGPSVRILMLSNSIPNFELFNLVDDKVSEPILVSTRGLSDPFSPGSGTFTLVIKDPKAESGYRPVGTVTLPEQGKDFILLLEPVAPAEFKPYVVNSRQPLFGADSVLFFNACDVTVGAELGDKKALIPIRKITILQAPARKGEVPYYQVALYQWENEEARMFSTTRWPHRSAGRNYVFIYRDAETGRLTYRGIDEPMPREK
jgi:hypothetical protein